MCSKKRLRFFWRVITSTALCAFVSSFIVVDVQAEQQSRDAKPFLKPRFNSNYLGQPRGALLPVRSTIIDLGSSFSEETEEKPIAKEELAKQEPAKTEVVAVTTKPETVAPVVPENPSTQIVPPDQAPVPGLNPEAPGSFKGMVGASRQGDMVSARAYSDQYVDYLVNLLYEVRSYTQMIGESLVKKGILSEESWVGAGQYTTMAMAQERRKNASVIKATHDLSLKRIKADKQHKAEIYVFCNLSSTWCREMAPDIERLWQVVRGDGRLKMAMLLIGDAPGDWVQSFRDYTGLTVPLFDGSEMAKQMRIAFVPAVIVVSPSSKISYLRTGKQSFSHLFELVRAVQGVPMEVTPAIQALANRPIGQLELALQSSSPVQSTMNKAAAMKVAAPVYHDEKIERF